MRSRSNRIVISPNQTYNDLVLLSFSVDLTEAITVPVNNGVPTGSIVLNAKGQKLAMSNKNIAPRVGFFGDPNKPQEVFQYIRKREDQIFGGVKGVKVYIAQVGFSIPPTSGPS